MPASRQEKARADRNHLPVCVVSGGARALRGPGWPQPWLAGCVV